MIRITYESTFLMRGATRGRLQLHQVLRLPHKMNVTSDLRHISNVISNARSKQRHPATSPNTAPATQNECHQWSASHMKPHFQCVEAVKSPANLTKYCACHAKWTSSMICVTYEMSFPMRGGSKATLQPHQILRLPRKMNVINDLRHFQTSFPMRGGSKVTRQPHQILRLPRKMNVINDLRHIWNVISNAWRQ